MAVHGEVTWQGVVGDEWRGTVKGYPSILLQANPYRWRVLYDSKTNGEAFTEGRDELMTGPVEREAMINDMDLERVARKRGKHVPRLRIAQGRAEAHARRIIEKLGPRR